MKVQTASYMSTYYILIKSVMKSSSFMLPNIGSLQKFMVSHVKITNGATHKTTGKIRQQNESFVPTKPNHSISILNWSKSFKCILLQNLNLYFPVCARKHKIQAFLYLPFKMKFFPLTRPLNCLAREVIIVWYFFGVNSSIIPKRGKPYSIITDRVIIPLLYN